MGVWYVCCLNLLKLVFIVFVWLGLDFVEWCFVGFGCVLNSLYCRYVLFDLVGFGRFLLCCCVCINWWFLVVLLLLLLLGIVGCVYVFVWLCSWWICGCVWVGVCGLGNRDSGCCCLVCVGWDSLLVGCWWVGCIFGMWVVVWCWGCWVLCVWWDWCCWMCDVWWVGVVVLVCWFWIFILLCGLMWCIGWCSDVVWGCWCGVVGCVGVCMMVMCRWLFVLELVGVWWLCCFLCGCCEMWCWCGWWRNWLVGCLIVGWVWCLDSVYGNCVVVVWWFCGWSWVLSWCVGVCLVVCCVVCVCFWVFVLGVWCWVGSFCRRVCFCVLVICCGLCVGIGGCWVGFWVVVCGGWLMSGWCWGDWLCVWSYFWWWWWGMWLCWYSRLRSCVWMDCWYWGGEWRCWVWGCWNCGVCMWLDGLVLLFVILFVVFF